MKKVILVWVACVTGVLAQAKCRSVLEMQEYLNYDNWRGSLEVCSKKKNKVPVRWVVSEAGRKEQVKTRRLSSEDYRRFGKDLERILESHRAERPKITECRQVRSFSVRWKRKSIQDQRCAEAPFLTFLNLREFFEDYAKAP